MVCVVNEKEGRVMTVMRTHTISGRDQIEMGPEIRSGTFQMGANRAPMRDAIEEATQG